MNPFRTPLDPPPKARPLPFRPQSRPDLTVEQILEWCDAFHKRFGRWPARNDGTRCLPDTNWAAVDACLKGGSRGLKRGSSLAKLLLAHRGRRHKGQLPRLTPTLILQWADDHHARTGEWPAQDSGPVLAAPDETWSGINSAMSYGLRGLRPGSSIAQLLTAQRGVRNHLALPPLTTKQILRWADQHHTNTGHWPRQKSGPIVGAPGESWQAIDAALLVGCRGLPGGSSLARLLQAERGVRNLADMPRLYCRTILRWADAHFQRTGRWPATKSGPIPEASGESWFGVDSALRLGRRGMASGSSLARFLNNHGRGVVVDRPPLTLKRILAWADAYHRRSGAWPTRGSGAIPEALGETWRAVDHALRSGRRGLSGGHSLPQLLEAKRGVRNRAALPALTTKQILAWADAYHARTGQWPNSSSGSVIGAPGEKWSAVCAALEDGVRGLPQGGSLATLLAQERDVRNHMALPPFSIPQILAWADAHHARIGEWPSCKGGPIHDAPGETWSAVEIALRNGLRGLRGGDTLARLLARRRGKRNRKALPPLSVKQIQGWIGAHFRRTGRWPRRKDGPIPATGGETWMAVESALSNGQRGLSGGSSLARLVEAMRAQSPAV